MMTNPGAIIIGGTPRTYRDRLAAPVSPSAAVLLMVRTIEHLVAQPGLKQRCPDETVPILINTRYQAGRYPLLGPDFHRHSGQTSTGWIAPACGWRTYSITSSARARSIGGTSRPSDLAVGKVTQRICRGDRVGGLP